VSLEFRGYLVGDIQQSGVGFFGVRNHFAPRGGITPRGIVYELGANSQHIDDLSCRQWSQSIPGQKSLSSHLLARDLERFKSDLKSAHDSVLARKSCLSPMVFLTHRQLAGCTIPPNSPNLVRRLVMLILWLCQQHPHLS
jgi:hypothetical protein